MAVKYWYRPNNGSSNYNTTGSWFLGSGGTGGSTSNPNSADDVILDSNSGTGTLTISATASCRSFNSSTFGGTLAGTAQLNVTTAALSNQVVLSLGGNHNFTGRLIVNGSANNGLIYFNGRNHNGLFDFTTAASFTAFDVKSNSTSVSLAAVTFNNIFIQTLTFNSGTIIFGQNTINNIGAFSSTSTSTFRLMNFNNAVINLFGNADTIWTVNGITQGNFAFSNVINSTININPVNYSQQTVFNGGGGTYGNLNINRTTTATNESITTTFTGLNNICYNFRDLTKLPSSSTHTIIFAASSNGTAAFYVYDTFQFGTSTNLTIIKSTQVGTNNCYLYKLIPGLVICPNVSFQSVYAYNDFAFWYGISGSYPAGGGGGIIFGNPPRRLGSLGAG
jgi:hypothetical protein